MIALQLAALLALTTRPMASPTAQAYTRIPCATLAEGAPRVAVPEESAYYGALLAAALHAHGFDREWPHVGTMVLSHALTDWEGCFQADKVPTKAAPR